MTIKTYFTEGLANYAKILGDPVPGFDENSKEWTFDLILNEDQKKAFLASGADKFYIKETKDGQDFVRFVRKATKKDGTEGKPITVIGPTGEDWPQDKLIGNGSVLRVKYSLNEVKSKGTKRLKPSVIAVQVWDHKPYKRTGGFETRADSNVMNEASNW